ncbi:MAG: hypothetical protein ACKVZ0_14320 [Gemmatimonadales bacterium]
MFTQWTKSDHFKIEMFVVRVGEDAIRAELEIMASRDNLKK